MIKNGYYSYLRLPVGEYRVLREIMSTREFVSKQMVSVKNQIHRWLDLWFPEYKKVFKDVFCRTSLITLKIAQYEQLTNHMEELERKALRTFACFPFQVLGQV